MIVVGALEGCERDYNICLPFSLHKLTSIYWSCEEILSSQNSDKADSLILLCSTLLRAHKNSGKSLTIQ